MASIRIIATPPGEAPEEIRRAWIGADIPLSGGRWDRPHWQRCSGVLTGGRSFWAWLLDIVMGRTERVHGFAVNAETAVQALEAVSPEAASWWRTNLPDLASRGLFFDVEVCERVAGSEESAHV